MNTSRLGPTAKITLVLLAVATVIALVWLWSVPERQTVARQTEALCRESEAARGLSLANEDCTKIASQIHVLPRNTGEAERVDAFFPRSLLKPGGSVPAAVAGLKPVPQQVAEAYPKLQGFHYFLSGQNIVLVDQNGRIALTIDVRLRPERDSSQS